MRFPSKLPSGNKPSAIWKKIDTIREQCLKHYSEKNWLKRHIPVFLKNVYYAKRISCQEITSRRYVEWSVVWSILWKRCKSLTDSMILCKCQICGREYIYSTQIPFRNCPDHPTGAWEVVGDGSSFTKGGGKWTPEEEPGYRVCGAGSVCDAISRFALPVFTIVCAITAGISLANGLRRRTFIRFMIPGGSLEGRSEWYALPGHGCICHIWRIICLACGCGLTKNGRGIMGYKCVCGRTTKTWRKMQKHMKRVHPNKTPDEVWIKFLTEKQKGVPSVG